MATLFGDPICVHEDQHVSAVDIRRHHRFEAGLKALYYVRDENEGLEKCRIVNVSYRGLGIQFNQAKTCETSLAINLGVVVKWQVRPISLKGRIRWLRENQKYPLGGVELDDALDNMTLLKLL